MSPAYALPSAAAPDYARQGAVVLRGVLTPDEVATLARGAVMDDALFPLVTTSHLLLNI